jgi:hypothetical protein
VQSSLLSLISSCYAPVAGSEFKVSEVKFGTVALREGHIRIDLALRVHGLQILSSLTTPTFSKSCLCLVFEHALSKLAGNFLVTMHLKSQVIGIW